ncbi:MAG TPA: hypothetical protein VKY85_06310, partial [Candidatus Angelobacter sp.]|nr:hypothetical protein [Candidatus Angelobacter sp.]
GKRQPRASHIPTATATAPLLLGKQIKRKVELIAPYTVSHPQIFQTKLLRLPPSTFEKLRRSLQKNTLPHQRGQRQIHNRRVHTSKKISVPVGEPG